MKVISGVSTVAAPRGSVPIRPAIGRTTSLVTRPGAPRKRTGPLASDAEDLGDRDAEAGQVRLGRDLLADVEQLGLGPGPMDQDGPGVGVDEPDQGRARIQVGADL